MDADAAVGPHRQSPSFCVESVVVVPAQWQQVRQISASAVFPPVDVMGLGDGDVPCAARDGAVSVHRPHGSALSNTGVSSTAAVVECDRPGE
jgi:hypothetical protein